MATWMRLELTTSSVTGWHSNQLNYQAANGDPWENRTPVIAVKGRCLNRLTKGPYMNERKKRIWVIHIRLLSMAPQVGFEPTAYRLTAECSTVELLRNINASQRSILPGSHPPSTFDAKELNFCVRDGNRCGLFAIVTTSISLFYVGSDFPTLRFS